MPTLCNSNAKLGSKQASVGQENITTLHVTRQGKKTEPTVKYHIDRVCQEENMEKYTQTQGTVCTQEPLKHLLGRFGKTEFYKKNLNGPYELPNGTPRYVKEFLLQMKKVDLAEDNVLLKITTKEFQEGWGKVKEAMSGKSGVHFGNLVACSEDDRQSQFESSIAQLPFLTGYSPMLWREGTIVMIKKTSGDTEVSVSRSILLLKQQNLREKGHGESLRNECNDTCTIW